ncbi:hypothetical protein MMC15_005499 [Xylographa vitiligo]|nr:hypothetical protein [Xylographa vitiligo]
MALLQQETNAYDTWVRLYERWYPSRKVRVTLESRPIASPLYYASRGGLTELVAELLLTATDISDLVGYEGSDLHIASACGHVEIVQMLLDKMNDPNQINKKCLTPLVIATTNGHEE